MQPEVVQSKSIVQIAVKDPLLDTTGGFTTYMVIGHDQIGTFQIRRRFNDFFYFREALKKKWPAIYIPPIPQKKLTGNKDDQHVQFRRKFFDHFLKRLAQIKHLFACQITQQFLRNKTVDMQKYCQILAAPTTLDVIQQYKLIFGEIDLKNINQTQLKQKTTNFLNFLKKAQKQLKNMRTQITTVVETRNIFMQNLNKCNEAMLPEYQKTVYSQYTQEGETQLLFVTNPKVQDNIRLLRDNTIKKTNPFQFCLDLIIYQVREVQAMLQAFNGRDNYEINKKKLQQKCLSDQAQVVKLTGGKMTFKSLFSKGSKNQQKQILEKIIPQTQKQIEAMGKLCQFLTYILEHIQITTFKTYKQKQYYAMMASVSNGQLIFLNCYGEFAQSLIQGLNK